MHAWMALHADIVLKCMLAFAGLRPLSEELDPSAPGAQRKS